MTGFCGGDGGVDGFEVAHFADENDVGILAQGAAESFGEVRNVDANLALSDQRFFVLMIIFDGVFDGDDVGLVAFFVDDVNHRGERGCFAGTSRAGDETETARFVEHFLDRGRQADLLHRQQLGGDLAQDGAEISFLSKYADA